MNTNKFDSLLNFALTYPRIVSEQAFFSLTGQILSEPRWEILMRYYGRIEAIMEEVAFTYQKLSASFLLIKIDYNKISQLGALQQVVYLELPRVMNYILDQNISQICVGERTYSKQGFGLSGKGILVGIVDSGIDYRHDDFRYVDGSTRILSLWDQNGDSNPPVGFEEGSVYTREQINEALLEPTPIQMLEKVPEQDILGHGTALAGIAAGNGRASRGKYTGIAPESELVVVKVSNRGEQENLTRLLPRNVDVMLGVRYVLEEAIKQDKPVSIVIGFGLTEGAHNGRNSMETFLDQASLIWKNNIVVGVGNQGNKDNHTSGTLKLGEEKDISIFIDENQEYYLLTMVSDFLDTIDIQLQAPNGEKTEILQGVIGTRAAVFGETSVLINFAGPNVINGSEQITILIEGYQGGEVVSGIWTLRLFPREIIDGRYNIWGSSIDPIERLTRFLESDPYVTLTIPSTSQTVTSVGGLDGRTGKILNFSGRGYTSDGRVKPDVAAPASAIMAPTSLVLNDYALVTGTSAAAAFVAGGYALLLEYGVLKQPDSYYYGEILKAYVIKGAKRLPAQGPYPNRLWGYGGMCVQSVLETLEERYNM